MDRLMKIVKSLKEEEYQALYNQISANHADKSPVMLNLIREGAVKDKDFLDILNIGTNAFYTLKSRLNQKIENFLISRMESPKLALVQNVHYAIEQFFNLDREILIVMFRKLEKELIDYDLPNELTLVYQNLKKLTIHDQELYYQYSQLYNKQVAYNLAVNKADDLVGTYFNIFNQFYLSRNLNLIDQLKIIKAELNTLHKLYESHRLLILYKLVFCFHAIHIEKISHPDSFENLDEELNKIDKILDKYTYDPFYLKIKVVFDFLNLEYYHSLGLYKKEEQYLAVIKDQLPFFLDNFSYYTCSAIFLRTLLERYSRLDLTEELIQNYADFILQHQPEVQQPVQYLAKNLFDSSVLMIQKKWSEAVKTLNQIRNAISLKNYPHFEVELKCALALCYANLKDEELFNQVSKSIHRQVKLNDQLEYENVKSFLKYCGRIVHEKEEGSKLHQLFMRFYNANNGSDSILTFLTLPNPKLKSTFINEVIL